MSVHASIAVTVSLLAAGCVAAAESTAPPAHHDHDHHHWDGGRPDGHAPIGVMGDHVHGAGEWMFSYRFMRMTMDGMRDGTSDVSSDDILMPDGSYMMAPEDMVMDMHMFGVMYAPSDRVTLMTMIPWVRNRMTVRRRMPMMGIDETFVTRSEGLGDVSLTALIDIASFDDGQRLHAGIGVSAPTGSIDETDATPMGADTPLPYPMQTGSGTWDLLPSVTWIGQGESWSWGAQAGGRIHLGENDHDYTLGDRVRVGAWAAWRAVDIASFSLRLDYQRWGDIDGTDAALAPNAATRNPNADPDLRAGSRIDLGLGVNLLGTPDSVFPDHRVAAEVLLPIHEDLDGPQMSVESIVILGWQYAF